MDLEALEKKIQAASKNCFFWWRDDDANKNTPQLQKLFALQIPIHLAVIPEGLVPFPVPNPIQIWQHGFAHRNYYENDPKQKKSELTNKDSEILKKLNQGHAILKTAFGKAFTSVLTPPWNRIDPILENALPSQFKALSVTTDHKKQSTMKRIDISIDLMDWKLQQMKSERSIYQEILDRLSREKKPIGFLSHHLIHKEKDFVFFKTLIKLIGKEQFIQL